MNKKFISVVSIFVILLSGILLPSISFAVPTTTCVALNQQLSSGLEGMTMDPSGNIYLSDSASRVIRKYDYSNSYAPTIFAGQVGISTTPSQEAVSAISDSLSLPRALAWDKSGSGNLLILDFGANVIRRVDADNKITTFFSMSKFNLINSRSNVKIRSFTVDSISGDIYIGMDTGSAGQIVKIPSNYAATLPDGSNGYTAQATSIATTAKKPASMAAADGIIYFGSLASDYFIFSVSKTFVVSTLYTPDAGSVATSLTFDESGNLWASMSAATSPKDSPHYARILKFRSSGLSSAETPTVMVSNSAVTDNLPKLGTSISTSSILAIAVNGNKGGLFIADNFAHTLQQVSSLSASGQTISTVAGVTGKTGTTCLAGNPISVTQSSGGAISPGNTLVLEGPGSMPMGSQKFTFTPSTGYSVASITIDGTLLSPSTTPTLDTAISSTGYTFYFATGDAPHTISATFSIPDRKIAVYSGPNGAIKINDVVPTEETTTVTGNTSQAFTFTPSSGYSVESITLDGTPLSASTTPTLALAKSSGITIARIAKNYKVAATFALTTYAITVTQGSNGTISPTSVTLTPGVNQLFTFTPATNYSVASITIDGTALSGSALTSAISSSYEFLTVATDHTVAATYSLITYVTTVTQGSNGTISPGTTPVGSSSNQIFTFTPATNYSVESITIDGTPLSASTTPTLASAISSGYTFSTVTSVHTVTATYALITYAITVTQGSNGTISPGTTTVGSGTNQAFTFTPSTGYSVASITIDGTDLAGSALTSAISSGYTFSTVAAVHTVTATYALITYVITVTQGSNGTISPGTTTAGSGSNQTFTFTPATNYSVASITIDGTALSGSALTLAKSSGYTFSSVATVHTVTATYSLITYAITVTQSSNGTISPATTTAGSGSNKTFTFSSSTGYSVASITIDGTDLAGSALTLAISSGYTFSTVAAVHTVTATWSHNEYAVTFYKNNVSATGTMAIESKTAATALTANSFALVNNVFLSWNTTESGTGTSYSDSQSYLFIVSANLYAQWGSVISYSKVGADSGSPSRLSENWSSGAITSLPTVGTMAKAGYSFGGWSDGTTTYVTTYTPTMGITLNPVWTPKTYTVSFNKNGASTGTVPIDQTWDESITALTLSGNTGTLVKHGYTFGGWATSASTSQSVVTSFSSTSNILTKTFYAIWTPVSYSVSYVLNGGTSTVPTEIDHIINETFTVAATPIRDTYVFGGWSNGTTIYAVGNSYTVETSTINLTAQWIATYTVHYIMNGSATTPESDARYSSGTVITTAVAPSLTGYTFDHWLASNSLTPASNANFTVIASSTLMAIWTPVAYTVTYALNGGTSTLPTQSNVNINNVFSVTPTEPIKAGYLFADWSDGTNKYGSGASYTVGSADITLTAQWTAISYKVTYDLGGGVGTLPTHANVIIGDTFTVSTEVDPTRLARTFAGWSDGSLDYAKSDTYTTSSSNITLTAKWTLNGYTQISYALGGGSGTLPTQSALLEGSTFIVASGAALTKSGQAFIGWIFATITYQFNDVYDVGSYTDPVILTAQWATGYGVTYSVDTATVTGTVPTDAVLRVTSSTFTLSSGSTLNKTGYTFAGWNDGVGTYLGGTTKSIGSADLIFTAQWTLIVVAAAPVVSAPTVSNPIVIIKIEPVVIPKIQITPDTDVTSPVVAAQIALIQDQSNAQSFFAALPPVSKNVATKTISNPTSRQIQLVGELISINTQSAATNSSEIAIFKLPATNVVLSDLVVIILEEKVKLVSTVSGFSVTPVSGFTGILIIPVVATVSGVEVTILNRIVVNPVAPVAIGFTPKSVKESAISWTPSASQVVAYVVEVNGKTLCQTTSNGCPVPALIGPNSKVTISAVGNDQTSSAPEVIPYVVKAPIPALTVAFASNSSRLSPAQKTELRKVAKIIEREGFTRLVVSGFTDAQGSAAANKVLSAARAKATAAFLTELLPEITLKISSFGAKQPVKAGTSATAYGANRRSEISVW